jgi:hypothetical protein
MVASGVPTAEKPSEVEATNGDLGGVPAAETPLDLGTSGHARRTGVGRRALLLALSVAVGVAGTLAVVHLFPDRTSAPTSATVPSGITNDMAIDMSGATATACPAPVRPGAAHPQTVLSQVFTVHDEQHRAYTLGWEIIPYRGPNHTYRLGQAGNLLALESASGGSLLGYGSGMLTVGPAYDTGSVRATVTLADDTVVPVTGAWHCRVGSR